MSDGFALNVDEDGFVCLVAPETYHGFVDEDWELGQLLGHFVSQMNLGSLFIAYPGPDDAGAAVAFVERAARPMTTSDAVGSVVVGPGGLWVTDYAQLTMAAQFDDEAPTSSGAVRLSVHEGVHRVTLQRVNGDPGLILTLTPLSADERREHLRAVPWFA
ncbi:hypothetical protein [Microbacterium hatanonis]|uniref:Uncharacterized protein n=1 Tax=Microbacterium hatanonis TaxID=404366 RepID=A0A5C8I4B5_9MICO|nr:hypothetical protein [Microbacterium hatanonis]TXK12960.1 hypothetical protein FVP77_05815 [Microbacterium hatanonis]